MDCREPNRGRLTWVSLGTRVARRLFLDQPLLNTLVDGRVLYLEPPFIAARLAEICQRLAHAGDRERVHAGNHAVGVIHPFAFSVT